LLSARHLLLWPRNCHCFFSALLRAFVSCDLHLLFLFSFFFFVQDCVCAALLPRPPFRLSALLLSLFGIHFFSVFYFCVLPVVSLIRRPGQSHFHRAFNVSGLWKSGECRPAHAFPFLYAVHEAINDVLDVIFVGSITLRS